MPTYLKNRLSAVVAALCLTLASVPGVCDAPAHVAAILPADTMETPLGFSGTTGLVRIPTAEVARYGTFAFGLNVLSSSFRPYPNASAPTVAHFITVGVFPQVEASIAITNYDGRIGLGPRYRWFVNGLLGGWKIDRMFSAQAVVLRQTPKFPVSIGLGYQDLAGTGAFHTRYAVFTRRWPRLGLHAGFGDGRIGGLFAGADYQPVPHVRLMAEHDGRHPYLGATIEFYRIDFTPVLAGFKTLQGGISYRTYM